jgi:predicted transposase/invertase (TIGR01784 family)
MDWIEIFAFITQKGKWVASTGRRTFSINKPILEAAALFYRLLIYMNNPHDSFARKMMGVLDNARDFFRGVRPHQLTQQLDLLTLSDEAKSFVDERLKDHLSDMVFSCRYKHTTAQLVLLFEHKSYRPPYFYLQLLRYMLHIQIQYIENNRKPPIIIPIVLYHGRTRWKKRRISEYMNGPDTIHLRQFIPQFEYIFVDLSTISEKQIASKMFKRPEVKVWLLVQKYIFHPKALLNRLNNILRVGILTNREQERDSFLELVFRYILLATNIEPDEIAEAIADISPRLKEEVMTTGEKLIQEGIEKGTILEKQEVLIKQLSRKFGLTEEEQEFIKSINDRDKLDASLDEILFAETKEEVLNALRK